MPFAHTPNMHIGHFALNPKSVATRARSQAFMQLQYVLPSYAKHIGHFALNPNSVATHARFQAIMQLRDALPSYAKHICHFALNPNSVATRARSQAIIQLRDELLLYAKHIGHFVLNPNLLSYSCSVSSNHAIARCTSFIRQTHWPRGLKSKVSSYSYSSPAIMQLRDALLSYAKHIGHCALNPKSVATRARFQAIMQLRDAHLLYAKHIGNCALNPNSIGTRARSPAIMQLRDALLLYAQNIGHFASNPNSVANHTRSRSPAIMHCEMHFSPTPNTLATAKSIVGLVLGLKQSCIARCTSVIRQTQWSSFSQAKCNNLLRKLGVNQ
jgi:hypothetical protein